MHKPIELQTAIFKRYKKLPYDPSDTQFPVEDDYFPPTYLTPVPVDAEVISTTRANLDQTHNPKHYIAGNGLQVKEVRKAFELNFNLGNVLKYILRCGKKGGRDDAILDLTKAMNYLQEEINDQMEANRG